MNTERVSTRNGSSIRKAYSNNFNYVQEMHSAIIKNISFPFINSIL